MNYLKSIVVVVFAGTTFAISLPVMAQRGDVACPATCDYPPDHPCGGQCNTLTITGNGNRVTPNRKRSSSPATSNSSQIPNDDSNTCPTVVLGANHPCGTQYKTIRNTVLRGSRRISR